jgi:hypothetical protein
MLGDGSRGHGACDSPRAVAGPGGGARATRHVAAPKLPYARRWEPWDTRACTPVLSFILTWSSYAGVSDLQYTDSGPMPTPGEAVNPRVGSASFSVQPFLSFVRWDFEVVVQHGRNVVAHDLCGTLRYSECLAEPSCAAIPLGLSPRSGSRGVQGNHDHDSKPSGRRAAEVAGVEVIVTTIPELTGRRTYGVCGTFHFCTTIPLG